MRYDYIYKRSYEEYHYVYHEDVVDSCVIETVNGEGTYAYHFEQDEEILFRILQRKSAYIGMLAGNFKVQTIYNHLRARGVPDEQLRKVHAPIGLEIAAETPEEIALSIASELVFVKNQRTDNKAVSGDIPAAD